ncbi:MAG: SgcJ/EcaC family oxidoreductase [Mycobacterium sp.]
MPEDRPTLSDDEDRIEEARLAVDAFVAELQAGVDGRDADVFNAHFADDVLWGTPFGDTVLGYDTLHDVHRRMLPRSVGGASSRYETVRVSAPAPDVAVAQVRRIAMGEDGTPIADTDPGTFSEMTTFVLVRRARQWWLAAGQHTPIRPKR